MMIKKVHRVVLLIFFATLIGCETLVGVTKDVGNTARNLRDIITLGKDIEDIAR